MAEAAKLFNLAVLAAVATYVGTVVVALEMIVTIAGIVPGVAALVQAVVSYTNDLIRARDAFFARQDKQATMCPDWPGAPGLRRPRRDLAPGGQGPLTAQLDRRRAGVGDADLPQMACGSGVG